MPPRKRRSRTPVVQSSPTPSAASPSASASPTGSPTPPPVESSTTPSESPDTNVIDLQIQKWEQRGREILKQVEEKVGDPSKTTGNGKDDGWCVGDVAMAIADDFVEWAVKEVCVEEHWARWKENGGDKLAVLLDSDQLLDGDEEAEGGDKNAKHSDERKKATKNVNVVCSNCSGSIAAARYAQHLEKCLGRGGRSSSRAATARMKASAKRAEKEDMEQILPPSRNNARKRRATTPLTAGDGSNSNGKRTKSQSPPPPIRGRFGTKG